MDPLEAVKIETQKGNMTCISFSFSLNLFIDLNHRLATGQQTQGHGLSGEAVRSLVGSSDDTFGLALLPDDHDERCLGFQTGFCHVNNTNFLTRELCCVGFRDLGPKPMVKELSHDRRSWPAL